jgi:hypothetical protein
MEKKPWQKRKRFVETVAVKLYSARPRKNTWQNTAVKGRRYIAKPVLSIAFGKSARYPEKNAWQHAASVVSKPALVSYLARIVRFIARTVSKK